MRFPFQELLCLKTTLLLTGGRRLSDCETMYVVLSWCAFITDTGLHMLLTERRVNNDPPLHIHETNKLQKFYTKWKKKLFLCNAKQFEFIYSTNEPEVKKLLFNFILRNCVEIRNNIFSLHHKTWTLGGFLEVRENGSFVTPILLM
jgi:hypothetical protein